MEGWGWGVEESEMAVKGSEKPLRKTELTILNG